MKKILIFFLCFFFFTIQIYAKTVKYAFVRYKIAYVRKGPSKRYKYIAKLKKNTKVFIFGYKRYYYKVKSAEDNIEGWIYYRALTKPVTKKLPDFKVNIKFNNINKVAKEKILEFKNFLNFDFYKKDVSITFSYDPEFNVGRIFITTDFNQQYYNKNKAGSLKINQIDLYPFLDFAINFSAFNNKLGEKYRALKEFLRTFRITLLLKKSETNYIILEYYRKNKLFFYYPYIYLKKEGFRLIKIPTDDKKLLKRSYIFTLGVPMLYDGTKTVYSTLYDFFDISY